MSYIPGRIRGEVNVAKGQSWLDKQTSESPEGWRGFALQIELAFFTSDTQLMTLTGFQSITVEIHDNEARVRPALLSVQATDFRTDLSIADWENESSYHCKANFTESEMALDLDGQEKTFWIFVHGINSDFKRVPLGGTTLKLKESGVSTVTQGPNQGANLITGGMTYDGSGNRVIATTAGKLYDWTKGANDTSIVNGSDTYTTSQRFTAQGTSVTLTGTIGALVTAQLRYPIYPTLDELYALLLNVCRSIRLPGQYDVYVSKESVYQRTVGVDDDGNRIDQVEEIT